MGFLRSGCVLAQLPYSLRTGAGTDRTEVLLQPEGAAADAPVLCARLGPDQAVRVGETVTVSFAPARLLMLEERTGR